VVPNSIAQTAIDVPPRSRLLLPAIGGGDQVHGCVNGHWALTAPQRHWKPGIPLMNQESKRFIFAKEFIRERNWIEGHAHDE